MSSTRILVGDCRALLGDLEPASVQTCVTSPPYYGLRDYGVAGQLGLERTPEDYIVGLVERFRGVHRALRDDGTVWLNLGDSYVARPRGSDAGWEKSRLTNPASQQKRQAAALRLNAEPREFGALKPKDLIGIPWRVALALQADGWYLRADVVWHKPNAMPEPVTDRPTRAHEYVFLLSKSARYYYDHAAIREPFADERQGRDGSNAERQRNRGGRADGFTKPNGIDPSANGGRNARSVWSISTQPFPSVHFATMAPELARRCILAGSRPGDTVLDPFGGAGTTGLVAQAHGRDAVLLELNPEYAALAEARLAAAHPGML